RRVAWAILDPPFEHYSGVAWVEPEVGGARFTWTADLLPNEMADQVDAMMNAGIQVIKKTLERSPKGGRSARDQAFGLELPVGGGQLRGISDARAACVDARSRHLALRFVADPVPKSFHLAAVLPRHGIGEPEDASITDDEIVRGHQPPGVDIVAKQDGRT